MPGQTFSPDALGDEGVHLTQQSWQPGGGQHARHYEGLIGGVRFTVGYTARHGWMIIIYAC